MLPLFEPGLLMDAKIVSVASMDGTFLILRLRPPSILNAPLIVVVLYLLDMHHQPGEGHVIMDYHRLTLLLRISIDSYKQPAHLIPVV